MLPYSLLFVCIICFAEIQEVKTSIPSLKKQNSLLLRIEKWLYEPIYQVQVGQYTLRCIRSPRASHRSEYRHTTIV